MKLRKWLIIILLFLLIAGITGWYLYRITLPKVIAKAIINNKYPKLLPGKYKNAINKISGPINEELETLITYSSQSGITIEQLLKAVDEVKEDEVRKTLALLYKDRVHNPGEVFDIAVENIHIQAFEPRLLKNAFLKNVSAKTIKRSLTYIHSRNLLNEVEPKMARLFIKQLILQKQEKIKNKILNGT